MIKKLAYAIEMAFNIPDSEKEIANIASERFSAVIDAIDQAKDHLDLMYDPFKEHENISTESLTKRRGVLNRYKQQVKKNFNRIMGLALYALEKFNYFATDTEISELISAFKDSVEDVEKQVNIFLDILNDYESPDFRQNVLKEIEGCQKQCIQLADIIQDRIIDHIDANILTKNWVTNTGDDMNIKIQNRVPVVTELYNERQKALEGAGNKIPDIAKRPQPMTPALTQRVMSPNDLRDAGSEE